MPVAEVHTDGGEQELATYECAFHILPTVAEEEVPAVANKLEKLVAEAGGTIAEKELPQQINLSYEIAKQIEGHNRHFNAAHFGWMRFTATPAAIPELVEEINRTPEVLRSLTIRLTRAEEAQPFMVFASREAAAPEPEGDLEISRGDDLAEEQKG